MSPLYSQSAAQWLGQLPMVWENELHKFPLLDLKQGFEPKFLKSQQHTLANRLCCSTELPNQLFTLIESWPTLGIQPETSGAQSRSSQHPQHLRPGSRSGQVVYGRILQMLKPIRIHAKVLQFCLCMPQNPIQLLAKFCCMLSDIYKP